LIEWVILSIINRMAGQNKEAGEAPVEVKASNTTSLVLFPFISILNFLVILIVFGVFYYSRFVYKRPVITEIGERVKIEERQGSLLQPTTPGVVSFDPITMNIEPTPAHPLSEDGTQRQLQGKYHYATVAFTVEIRDKNLKSMIETVRPLIIDKLIQTVGKKTFQEVTTVQGRYILHTQIMDFTNQLITHHSLKPMNEGLVTNVFFTQFIVQ